MSPPVGKPAASRTTPAGTPKPGGAATTAPKQGVPAPPKPPPKAPRKALGRMTRPVGRRRAALKGQVVAEEARPSDRRGRIWT